MPHALIEKSENDVIEKESTRMSAVLENPPSPVTVAPASAPTLSVDDRRKYQARIMVELDLQLTTVVSRGPAKSLNLSVTGLLIATPITLVFGERVIISVIGESGTASCHLCAEVVRAVASECTGEINNYGLRILSDDARIWHELLRQLVLS